MPESTPASALALLDAATGGCLVAVRVLGRAVNVPVRVTVAMADEAGLTGFAREAAALGVAITPRVAVDLAEGVRRRGESARKDLSARATTALKGLLRSVVPAVIDLVLDRIDLNELVERRVDLDRLAAHLDIDKVLDRLDLNELVERRVDLDRLAAHLDIDKVLDRLDLDELIERRVDIDRIAADLELDPIVNRLDLIGLAEYVVDGIDLPQIIRASTGSVASEGLREVRTRSMDADQALAHLVDRMLPRRRASRDGRLRADENGSAPLPAPPAGDAGAP
jgi:hypothetical protein